FQFRDLGASTPSVSFNLKVSWFSSRQPVIVTRSGVCAAFPFAFAACAGAGFFAVLFSTGAVDSVVAADCTVAVVLFDGVACCRASTRPATAIIATIAIAITWPIFGDFADLFGRADFLTLEIHLRMCIDVSPSAPSSAKEVPHRTSAKASLQTAASEKV